MRSFVLIVALHVLSVSASRVLSSKHRLFADNLVSKLYGKERENECTSSLGVSMAFSLIYPSADETNQAQLRDVFGYPGDETHFQLVWDGTQHRLDTKYDGKCTYPAGAANMEECEMEEATLEIANRVWMTDSLMVGDDYANLLGEYLFQMDFHAGDAGSVINEWVNKTTRGLIESIVDDGSLAGIDIAAVNSIYLKASWTHQFAKQWTNLDSFYASPSRLRSVPHPANFMHTVNHFSYSETAVENFQILRLPFEGSLSMVIALPTADEVPNIRSNQVLQALPNLQSTTVAVALPKFRFTSTYKEEMKAALQSIGLTAPFDGGLCLGGEGGCNGKITQIIHKTVIDLNELGVEAAAVTAAISRAASPLESLGVPVLFLANHPFQFFIYENEEDLVIFEGYVSNPGADIESETPSLDLKHTTPSFWRDTFQVEPTTSAILSDRPSKASPVSLALSCLIAAMVSILAG